eukprot:m.436022 g.436022  ORF g.436022 m.436022 type:complete len:109 (-) comp17928_c0_seq1:247-573(-)
MGDLRTYPMLCSPSKPALDLTPVSRTHSSFRSTSSKTEIDLLNTWISQDFKLIQGRRSLVNNTCVWRFAVLAADWTFTSGHGGLHSQHELTSCLACGRMLGIECSCSG